MTLNFKRVKASGSKAARLVLIGEIPGRHENRKGSPFVGPSGQLLDEWWRQVGLSRKDFWIDNVYPYFNPKGIHAVHPAELKEWIANLHDRLQELDDPWLIIPTGDTALKALTGLKGGISKYRGSILEYHWNDKRLVKVIPTYHPAFTFRRPSERKSCIKDWERIAEESKFRDIRHPEREHFTRPTLDDLYWYGEQVTENDVLSIDAEWTHDNIVMVGFSADPSFGFVVPTTLEYWGSHQRLDHAWDWIRATCESDIQKVLQHGHSDAYVLRWFRDIRINNYLWDTLAMHHCLDPNSEHTLEYIASIDTREPYWKDEAKDPEKMARYMSNFDAFLTYNSIDNCVQRELFNVYHQRLVERDLLDFYFEHYQQLFEPMIELMLHGIQVDQQKRMYRHAALQCEVIKAQDSISEAIGEQCHAEKSLKGPVMMRYFYDKLRLPKVMRVRKRKGGEKVKTPSIDEVAIRRLMIRYPEKAGPVGQMVLNHRRKYQLMTFYG